MINTDKYEGHTENKWVWYEFNDGDWILCPLHDDVKPDPDDLWWGVDEETGEPLETHAALNWDERILDLSSDCMTGNNNPTRKDFVYCSHSSGRLPRKRADMNLIQDAPLLLEEVKRLRKVIYDSLYILETDEWSEEGSMDKLIQTLKDGWDWHEDYFAEMSA